MCYASPCVHWRRQECCCWFQWVGTGPLHANVVSLPVTFYLAFLWLLLLSFRKPPFLGTSSHGIIPDRSAPRLLKWGRIGDFIGKAIDCYNELFQLMARRRFGKGALGWGSAACPGRLSLLADWPGGAEVAPARCECDPRPGSAGRRKAERRVRPRAGGALPERQGRLARASAARPAAGRGKATLALRPPALSAGRRHGRPGPRGKGSGRRGGTRRAIGRQARFDSESPTGVGGGGPRAKPSPW